nr:hypothetical protein [Paenibacillus senegalensis]
MAASSLPMPKSVIADAGYGSEENYLYAAGEEKQPRFDFLIPYGNYLKKKTRRYQKDIQHASNLTYEDQDDRFVCPNGRNVRFKKYQTKKMASGLEQSFKIYLRSMLGVSGGRERVRSPQGQPVVPTVLFTGAEQGSRRVWDCGISPQSIESGRYPPDYFPGK